MPRVSAGSSNYQSLISAQTNFHLNDQFTLHVPGAGDDAGATGAGANGDGANGDGANGDGANADGDGASAAAGWTVGAWQSHSMSPGQVLFARLGGCWPQPKWR